MYIYVSHYYTSSISALKETVATFKRFKKDMTDSQRYRFNLYVDNNVGDIIVFLAEMCLSMTSMAEIRKSVKEIGERKYKGKQTKIKRIASSLYENKVISALKI